MARLVLHIGTHKTATTRIQNLFRHNHAILARHGVIYPQFRRRHGHHPLVGVWNPRLCPDGDFDPRAAWAGLATAYADEDQTVFLSSEEFSRLSPRRIDMAELAELTAPFGEVRILCSLRNQAGFLQSVYQEILKRQPTPIWEDIFETVMQTHMADGLTLDYDRLYSHLLGGFSRRQIRLISYDAALHEEDGIVGTYLRALDLPLRQADLAPIPQRRANISPPPLAAHAAAWLSRPEPPDPALIRQVQRWIRAEYGPRLRTTLLTRAEQARIAETFAPGNAALARRIAQEQPGFTIPPIPETGIDLWRDDLPPDFWDRITQRYRRPSRMRRAWRRLLAQRPE
ncbi:MAG: hypothetical protein ACK5M4_03350 [Pseudorhodobacter sp.]